MKITHQLKQHYQNKNTPAGVAYVPKQSFVSVEAARESGFYEKKWNAYKCDFCGNIHVGEKR